MKRWIFLIFAGVFALSALTTSAEAAAPFQDHTVEFAKVWRHLLWDIGIIGGIFGAISVIFLIKYKRKSSDQVGGGPRFSMARSLAWGLVPALIFMADDFYLAAQGWKLWIDQRSVPENAMEVQVTGQMWSWNFDYENGASSDNDEGLVVPVGTPVVLRMKSEDVIHSFFIPDFRIKEDLMPGRVTYLWFNPAQIGEHVFTCTEFCGTDHSHMFGKVKIVSKQQFDQWSQEHKG